MFKNLINVIENADELTERDFRREIELMKRIGYHDRLGLSLKWASNRTDSNLVNMLACVTVTAPVLLISEYCANGDLLRFMRQRHSNNHYNNSHNIFRRKYMIENSQALDESKIMTLKKQIMFSMQIASGLVLDHRITGL